MKKVIVIVGPTGVGKTKMSIELAKRFDGEVINADSTQVYRNLDIATAKVTENEKDGILHHLLDIRNIDEDYTVYHYQQDARKAIDDILSRGKLPIMVGGTGLYIKAVLYDYQFSEESQNEFDYEQYDDETLYRKLLKVDPETEIHPNNRKRIIRALQYYEVHKEPMSTKEKTEKILIPHVMIGLTTNREQLYDRINKRVDEMINQGLLDEAEKIYNTKVRSKAVMTPIGYKELFPYFDGTQSLEECIALMKQRSRHYAKRQYTWFHNQMKVRWFDVDFDHFERTVEEVVQYIKKQ